jgi:regulator of RNase E activity RraB
MNQEDMESFGDDEFDWSFSVRSKDVAALQSLADELVDEFDVQVHKQVEEIDMEGNSSFGDPLLSIVHRAALTSEEVEALESRIRDLAEDRGLIYDGVECYDPLDSEEVFGWIPPDSVGWRLRQLTENGLEEGAEMPWAFLLVAPDLEQVKRIATHFADRGIDDIDLFDEPDEEDGKYAICVFVPGQNDETDLENYCNTFQRVAEPLGGELIGVQFFTRDEMHEIYGIEESDSDSME